MIEASPKEPCFERIWLAALLLKRSEIGIHRPLRRNLDQLLLCIKGTPVGYSLGYEAFGDQLSRLHGRQEDEGAEQKKRHRGPKNRNRDEELGTQDVRKEANVRLQSEIEVDHAVHDEVAKQRPDAEDGENWKDERVAPDGAVVAGSCNPEDHEHDDREK